MVFCALYFLLMIDILPQATKDPFYLSVGERALEDITTRTKVACGLTTISNLLTGQQEDRMESFVLSETLKVCNTQKALTICS